MALDLNWPEPHGGLSGVHDHDGPLTWWHTPGGPNGRFGESARTQSRDDFLANGPAVSAPDGVVERVRAYLIRRR